MFPLLLQSMRVTDFQKRGATALQNGSINIYKRWSATCWGAPTFSPVFIGILGSLPPRRSRVTQRERESRSIQGNHNSIVLIHFPSILLLGGNFTFFSLLFHSKGNSPFPHVNVLSLPQCVTFDPRVAFTFPPDEWAFHSYIHHLNKAKWKGKRRRRRDEARR